MMGSDPARPLQLPVQVAGEALDADLALLGEALAATPQVRLELGPQALHQLVERGRQLEVGAALRFPGAHREPSLLGCPVDLPGPAVLRDVGDPEQVPTL